MTVWVMILLKLQWWCINMYKSLRSKDQGHYSMGGKTWKTWTNLVFMIVKLLPTSSSHFKEFLLLWECALQAMVKIAFEGEEIYPRLSDDSNIYYRVRDHVKVGAVETNLVQQPRKVDERRLKGTTVCIYHMFPQFQYSHWLYTKKLFISTNLQSCKWLIGYGFNQP